MTVNRLVFNLLGTAYLLLGSVHEEARLKAKYKHAYECYVRSGVPFYLPDFRRLPLAFRFGIINPNRSRRLSEKPGRAPAWQVSSPEIAGAV